MAKIVYALFTATVIAASLYRAWPNESIADSLARRDAEEWYSRSMEQAIAACVIRMNAEDRRAADKECRAQVEKTSDPVAAIQKKTAEYAPVEFNQVKTDQLRLLLVGIGLWFGLVFGAYFIGWLAAWVVKGFKPKETS
ncbi:hypothetical protein [Roseateles sp. P5_E4]